MTLDCTVVSKYGSISDVVRSWKVSALKTRDSYAVLSGKTIPFSLLIKTVSRKLEKLFVFCVKDKHRNYSELAAKINNRHKGMPYLLHIFIKWIIIRIIKNKIIKNISFKYFI